MKYKLALLLISLILLGCSKDRDEFEPTKSNPVVGIWEIYPKSSATPYYRFTQNYEYFNCDENGNIAKGYPDKYSYTIDDKYIDIKLNFKELPSLKCEYVIIDKLPDDLFTEGPFLVLQYYFENKKEIVYFRKIK